MLDVVGRVFPHQFTIEQDANASRVFTRAKQIVRGHENGDALSGELAQQQREFVRRGRVEAGGGFVEQQGLGFRREREGDADFLAHPFRVGADAAVGSLGGQTGAFEQREQFLTRVPPSAQRAEIIEVLHSAETRVEHDLLWDVGEVPPRRDGVGGDARAVDARLSGVRREEAEKQIDSRRLARAIGAEQREDFARLDDQVQFMDGDVVIEAFGQLDSFENSL